jgi:hypothetical protein
VTLEHPKDVIRYVMEVCALIQYNIVNKDIKKVNNQFTQVILHDPVTPDILFWFAQPIGLVENTKAVI